jgi:hypothetical protein
MTLYEFNILDEQNKYDTVFNKGQFVDSINKGLTKYALYSISMFWVEVVYNSETNKITGISTFIGGASLDKYSNMPKEI